MARRRPPCPSDAGGGVGLVQGAVEQRPLVDAQQAGGAIGAHAGAQQQLQAADHGRDRLGQRPLWPAELGRRVRQHQVERVELIAGGRRQPHHLAADGIGHRSVLVLGIDHQVVGAA